MKATFLSANAPLTKTFTLEDGELKKIGHPSIIEVTSWQHDFETLQDLHDMLVAHAELGHCFLKGNVTRRLIEETRAGSTDPNEVTRVLLLDLDGLKTVPSVDALLAQLGLHDVDHIVQYSSSMGIVPDKGLSAHVFMLLDKPWYPSMLKQWLIHVNLSNPNLRANISLSRTNNALRWALDVGTCQNDKLIYVAPPITGKGVVDTFEGPRIVLVERQKRVAVLPEQVPTAEANRVGSDKVLNELREKQGLPKRNKITFKSSGPTEYMAHPDRAVVTGIKAERGFVYLNLNRGDSWGYYHPEGNPTFIHNFKGEPTYLTSELLPDYWTEVKGTINAPRFDQTGTLYLAFRDFRTAGYWNGTWNRKTKELNMAQAKSADQLKSFLKQHGQPVGDFVPDWNVSFDPHSAMVVDPDARTVNLYQPSKYMQMTPVPRATVPPVIRRVVLHALGGDEVVMEHFMNWLAVVLQYKCRTMTAWVLHGTQGTGKGIMLNHILRPLFGMEYVVSKRMEELESQFNGFMERCFILFLDEAQMSSFGRKDVMDANFKNYIVEPTISIRRMHTMPYEVSNYLNLIFASNKQDPVIIDPEDRRFNVAGYQDSRLQILDSDLDEIQNEIEAFYHYLAGRKADRAMARTPLNNSAKQKMVLVGRAAVDVVCEALRKGDFAFLWDQRPTRHLKEGTGNTITDVAAGKYIKFLDEVAAGKKAVLVREDVQDVLAYVIGGVPTSPYKFTSWVKHHGMMFEPTTHDGKSVRGIRVDWKIDGTTKS